MTKPTQAHGAMPELPKPEVSTGSYAGPAGEGASENLYTADQMREYASAAIQQAAGAVPEGRSLKRWAMNLKDAPAALNINDKAMWVIGWNECLTEMEKQAPPASGGSSDHLVPCAGGGVTQPLTEGDHE